MTPAHLEDGDGRRLIFHHATPCQVDIARQLWDCKQISEEEYREREAEAMTPQGLDSRYAS